MNCTKDFVVRGIIHCHSTLSYDGRNSLEELCVEFQKQGFHFVALTEHSRGITREAYKEFVARCKALSSEDFVVLPGLEILCPGGIEIAGVGLETLVQSGSPAQVIAGIKKAGGFTIWVHPQKRSKLPDKPLESHAIEILNGKEDGTIAPALLLFRRIKIWQRSHKFYMIVGLDLHSLEMPRNVWTECSVQEFSKENIMEALFSGSYTNIISGISISPLGEMEFIDKIHFIVARIVYLLWNWFLGILPEPMFKLAIKITRSFVLKIKN